MLSSPAASQGLSAETPGKPTSWRWPQCTVHIQTFCPPREAERRWSSARTVQIAVDSAVPAASRAVSTHDSETQLTLLLLLTGMQPSCNLPMSVPKTASLCKSKEKSIVHYAVNGSL